jgi:hypothetical protein
MKATFNPAELTTFQEAVALRKTINYSPVFYTRGLQVLPYWNTVGQPALTNDTAGIYIPNWLSGPGGFVEPTDGLAHWYHFRFNNGFSGMNAGLVRGKFAAFPMSPLYVLDQLVIEVQGGA